jgi:hypothetical protein
LVQTGSDSIRQSIDLARGQLPDETFRNYCRVVGTILADTELELLGPCVYDKYPDLAPKAPSDPADQELMKKLETKFADASVRARRDSESS